VWLIIGLIFYYSYGRHKSTVALQEVERMGISQPRM
jgi:hypothetical protein